MRKARSGTALGRRIRNVVLYVKFEMNFRHSSEDGRWSMGYMSLDSGERLGDRNLEAVNIWMAF